MLFQSLRHCGLHVVIQQLPNVLVSQPSSYPLARIENEPSLAPRQSYCQRCSLQIVAIASKDSHFGWEPHNLGWEPHSFGWEPHHLRIVPGAVDLLRIAGLTLDLSEKLAVYNSPPRRL